ncbi:PHP domain-containing protein [Thauera sp. SDU_THAU2]|uniref:PHP domain-containing protein n=1 Tax=Thauera sp. SDU_THAU2 TaxID=3136633 RepID=UPI0040551CB5
MLPDHAELHCLSNFSFQRGASHPEELVAQAAAFGYAAIAITDECSLAGVVRAHRALQEQPEQGRPKLIIGSELQLADGPCIVLLASNRAGYGQLSRLITRARRAAGKGEYKLTRTMLDGACSDCLALLIPPADFPPPDWPVPARAEPPAAGSAATLEADAAWLAQRFPGRAWMAVTVRLDGRDRQRITCLRRIARNAGIPAVAASGALMHAAARRPLADVMTALRLHCSVAEAGLALAPNAEHRLHDRATLAGRYPPALLAETLAVAARCTFSLDELRYEYPAELVPDGETPATWLRRLVEGGLAWRYRQDGDRPAPLPMNRPQSMPLPAPPPAPFRRLPQRTPHRPPYASRSNTSWR